MKIKEDSVGFPESPSAEAGPNSPPSPEAQHSGGYDPLPLLEAKLGVVRGAIWRREYTNLDQMRELERDLVEAIHTATPPTPEAP